MPVVTGSLSVQAIKGKFERLPDFPTKSNETLNEVRHQKKSGADVVSYSTQPWYETSNEKEYRDDISSEQNVVSSRLRSLSVGMGSSNEKVETSKKKVGRNPSFQLTKQAQNGDLQGKDSAGNYSSYNFSSFAEKQRLVENIVMNIKNSAKKAEDENKNKESKGVRDIFSITSKFEKDLKNVIEKGAGIKWHSKSNLNKSHFEDKAPENISKTEFPSNGSRYIERGDEMRGVKILLPFRTYSNDALDTPDNEGKFSGFRSRSSPDLLRKNNKTRSRLKSSEESINHESCSQSSNSSHSKDENSYENISSFTKGEKMNLLQDKSSRETSPVRPPRRRVKKKAPLPPHLQKNFHESSYAKENFADCHDGADSKRDDEQSFKVKNDEHSIVSKYEKNLNSFWEVNNEFNYEENCERSLEGEEYMNDKTNANLSVDSSSSPLRSDDCSQNNSLQLHPLPTGSPPKKPPRTFAYDIYHTLKQEKKKPEATSSLPATKLTEEEIESLYTKPIKRLKDKSSSQSSSGKSSQSDMKNSKPPTPPKPTLAPKPPDLMNKSKKRLSAAEPLTTSHEEFPGEKSSIKRNSSFRFSFKKNAKSASPHLRQISPRRELKMGKKLKSVVRNFSPKRSDADKRVRFQSDYDDVANSEGVVYATPVTKVSKSKESPQELHYMCSPLFEDKENEVHHKENRPPFPRGHLNRPGLMDGLREELRQSCRFVQKRLKSTPTSRRKYKAVSNSRH